MGKKKTSKEESMNCEKDNTHFEGPDGPPDGNIVNENKFDLNENNGDTSSAPNVNDVKGNDESSHDKGESTTLTAEASGSVSRLRRRCKPVSYCPPRSPSPESWPCSSPKKMKLIKQSTSKSRRSRPQTSDEIDDLSRDSNITNHSIEDTRISNDENITKESVSFAAIALEKMKFDIKVDSNVEDRFVDSGFTAEGSTAESPESQQQRIDIISRQCRLHPTNKKYNQGPVENPPLISPGRMVGYTPGGQRHEVDLNADRPTWFNSEYARMQWDYATRVNVSRMIHDLETGIFLADGLDPDIERKYLAEQEMAMKQATEHFEEMAKASSSCGRGHPPDPDLTQEEQEHLRLLETEKELIELNKYAVVRLQDFAGEINEKLRKALDLPLTPLMIKKNPVILDTLERLSTQCIQIGVVLSARALLDKIKGLFQVPESQEFREFFDAEVEKLKEKTKDMSPFDIIMMTEEPPDDPDDAVSLMDTAPFECQTEEEPDLSEQEDEWIPVENGDVWIDSHQETTSTGVAYASSDFSSDMDSLALSDDIWSSDDENEGSLSEENDFDDNLDTQFDDLLGTIVSEE